MNFKWYVSTLFLVACISFGAFQEQGIVPNQEIVLEFVDTKINKDNIDNTIAEVKEKLHSVGVTNIVIQENENGTLKIAYYSTVDVKNIKEVLASTNQHPLEKKQNNKENSSSDYSVDVYELAQETDISTSNKKTVLHTKYNSNRFTTNNTNAFLVHYQLEKANFLFKIAYKASKNIPFSEDNSSYKEPEVRAGPKNYYL